MLKTLMKDKLAIISLVLIIFAIVVATFAGKIAPNNPIETNIIEAYAGSSAEFPLGTDHLGRCTLSRLIYGIRPTLLLALLITACTILIGTIIGVVSGFSGGIIDEIIMRVVDIMMSFPSQVMILAIVGMMGVGMKNVVIASIAIKWAWHARMIRASVLKCSNKNYILYSKAIGSGKAFIITKHIIPNILPEIIALATLDMGWVIISISTLSFLGLGVQAPTPELGAMLSEAKNVIISRPEQMLVPGVVILMLVASFNILGDSLRDVLDPRES